jgi:hypothetical protein
MFKNIFLNFPISKYISSQIFKRRFPHHFPLMREPLICDLCKKKLENGNFKVKEKINNR